MPKNPLFSYHPRAYYARPPLSIMPGRTWRDNGHKALCPLSVLEPDFSDDCARPEYFEDARSEE